MSDIKTQLENKLNERLHTMLDKVQSAKSSFTFSRDIVRPKILVTSKSLISEVASAHYFRKDNLGIIRFSDIYFNELVSKPAVFKETCYHELAHIIQCMYFPTEQPHSRKWKFIMWINGYFDATFNCPEIRRLNMKEKREWKWKQYYKKVGIKC